MRPGVRGRVVCGQRLRPGPLLSPRGQGLPERATTARAEGRREGGDGSAREEAAMADAGLLASF